MRMLFGKIITPTFALTLFTVSMPIGHTADLLKEEAIIPQVTEPIKIDTSEWGGFYVGAFGGYTWLQTETSISARGRDEGARLGGYVGYNWQFDNRIISGLEAQAALSDASAQTGEVNVEQNWDASLRARLGYAFENSLLYSFAGLAVSGVEASSLTGADEKTLSGFDIGAGIEFEIYEDLRARIEYDYDHYSDESFGLGAAGTREVDVDSHNVNVGIGLKF